MKEEILELREFTITVGERTNSISWLKHRSDEFHVLGSSTSFWYHKAILCGLKDSNLNLFTGRLVDEPINIKIGVRDINSGLRYVWEVMMNPEGICNESLRVKRDKEQISVYTLRQCEEIPTIRGSLGNDEISLSEISGNIYDSFKSFHPLLIESTEPGLKLSSFLKKSVFLGPSYFLRCDEDSLVSLGSKLDSLLLISEGSTLTLMKNMVPLCGFDVNEITDDGFAVVKVGERDHTFSLKDMGDGFGQLAIVLAVMESAFKNNNLVFIDNMFESIHPLLKNALIDAYIKRDNIGQVITTPNYFNN